jgi:shikimate dehydrogenase
MSEACPILGVAGRPILHSASPAIFRELFRASGRSAAYSRIAAASAEEALAVFRALGMRGMNLTSPFKEAAAALVDELSPNARRLGAVNCLIAVEGGRIRGDNTDPQGVLGALAARGIDAAGKRCLVLGAGGAGKAAALALISAGGEVVVANRTRSRADEVAALLGCGSASLAELPALARDAELVVSTLASDALPDPAKWFPASAAPAVLDADYKTGTLALFAAARGALAATGADWLVSQALPAYELFMGEGAPRAAGGEGLAGPIARMLERAPRAGPQSRKIALVGLMGAGKTHAGRVLAALMDAPFVDSDSAIEADAGASVAEIFAQEGEVGFRAREARVVDRITSCSGPLVLSTGGGVAASKVCVPLLAERCLTVWLYVSPATAAVRARGGSRPLLAGADPLARLAAIEAERRGAYAAIAELLVSTEGRGAEQVAEAIHDEIDSLS